MSKNAILEEVSPARFSAILALRAPSTLDDACNLQPIVHKLNEAAVAYGRAPAAKRWRVFAEAVEITRLLIEGHDAVISASIDADRFFRAARVRLRNLRQDAETDAYIAKLIEILAAIDGDIVPSLIRSVREQIASVAMPIGVFADPEPPLPDWAEERERQAPPQIAELAVAFIEFNINGVLAERLQSLRPRETHDLDIAVRVSRWPAEAASLVLSPISIEAPRSYELPTFEFPRPSGEPPFLFGKRGRMIIHIPQSLKARPFEFMYAAEFRPASCEQPVSVAGQRTLRLDGTNPDIPVSGYPAVDAKLMEIRNQLRVEPLILQRDLDDLLQVLVPLGNLMGQAVQDAVFPAAISESEFQKRVREFLRRHPNIGVGLTEKARATGGETDLAFRGIPIELKSEKTTRLLPSDCTRYAGQAASYAAGTNRRLAILCVLDCSQKSAAPFPIEDGLGVIPVDSGTSPIYVVSCLIQGNLAKPHSLSR